MSRILVTGGAGYIGSTLVQVLLDAGHEVTVLDRFYFGRQTLDEPLQQHGERLHLVRGDVRVTDAAVFAGIDAVIDLAGISNDPSCDLDPQLTRSINFDGASRVARSAHEAGVGRLVFASSCSIYGQGGSLSLTEDATPHPVSLYARCKADAERELIQTHGDGSMGVTALRFATVFGLSPRMRFDLAINVMTKCAHADRLIRVHGGGQQWRPFVHVKDVARAITAVLNSPDAAVRGRVFNVGANHNNCQIRQLAYRVRDRVVGTTVEVVDSDPDVRNYNVDFTRIASELGFEPQYSIDDGIDEIYQALSSGRLEGEDRRWYTHQHYLFLREIDRIYRQVAMDGSVLALGGTDD